MIQNDIITQKKIFISAESDRRTEIMESEVKKYLSILQNIQSILKDDDAKPAN